MKKGAKINIFWNFLLQGSVVYPLRKISKNIDFSTSFHALVTF